jgi:hypothetical protein
MVEAKRRDALAGRKRDMKNLTDAERAHIVVGLSMLQQTLNMTLGSATFNRTQIEGLADFDFIEMLSMAEIEDLIRKI